MFTSVQGGVPIGAIFTCKHGETIENCDPCIDESVMLIAQAELAEIN